MSEARRDSQGAWPRRDHHGLLALVTAVLASMGCGPSPEWLDGPRDQNDATGAPWPNNPPTVVYGSVLGRWRGMGVQSDGSEWPIVLDIANLESGPCAVIRYPSAGCSGYWICHERSDGSQVEAVERITQGRGRCVDQVAVKVALANDHESLCYFADSGDQIAFGRLTGGHQR
jgi:hypothetical protein